MNSFNSVLKYKKIMCKPNTQEMFKDVQKIF